MRAADVWAEQPCELLRLPAVAFRSLGLSSESLAGHERTALRVHLLRAVKLEGTPLREIASAAELVLLAESLHERTYESGAALAQLGEPSTTLFLLQSGRAQLQLPPGGGGGGGGGNGGCGGGGGRRLERGESQPRAAALGGAAAEAGRVERVLLSKPG